MIRSKVCWRRSNCRSGCDLAGGHRSAPSNSADINKGSGSRLHEPTASCLDSEDETQNNERAASRVCSLNCLTQRISLCFSSSGRRGKPLRKKRLVVFFFHFHSKTVILCVILPNYAQSQVSSGADRCPQQSCVLACFCLLGF